MACVGNDGQEEGQDLFLFGACVRQAEAHDGGYPDQGVLVVELVVVAEEGHGGLRVQPDARVHDSYRQIRTGLDLLLVEIGVLVDLIQTVLDIPHQQGPQRRHSRHHALLLGLPHPALLVLLHQHHLVVSETGVHEGVDKGGCQVVAGRVEVGQARYSTAFQMALVDVLGRLRLQDVELLAKGLEMLGQLYVAKAFVNLFVLWSLPRAVQPDPLASNKEGELLLESRVRRILKVSLDELIIIESDGEDHGLRVLLVLLVDAVRDTEELLVVGVGEQVDHRHHVQADPPICVLVDELGELLDDFELAHQVDGICLLVALEEERHEGQRKVDEVRGRLVGGDALPVDLANLERKMAHIFVAPGANVLGGGEEAVLQGILTLFVGVGHSNHGQDIGQ